MYHIARPHLLHGGEQRSKQRPVILKAVLGNLNNDDAEGVQVE